MWEEVAFRLTNMPYMSGLPSAFLGWLFSKSEQLLMT